MSGRHSGGTSEALRISALPRTLKLIFKLAPRQLNDEIALAKVEIKRKGIQLGIAAAFFGVALVFVMLLVIGLVVAAIMGLATIMPAWLAALLVCAAFLLIALIVALVGLRKFKKAMPLMPEDTLRGLKHDLGIAKEGSAFDAAVLDPKSEQYKAAKAAKAEASAKAKAEKEAKAAADPDFGPPPTESELRRRLDQRRAHLTGVRDELDAELDVAPQAKAVLAIARTRLEDGRELLSGKTAGFMAAARDASAAAADSQVADRLGERWRPLMAFTASAAAFIFLLRKLLKG
ncbi:phage holin family protein [Arthrobacter oryzae]|uniref:Phage holin family protein n=1 Tax=Arthrobacter oryzae TaxID=409290 RepID=A0A3N0C4J2_9MICC|nr:phage holin family protein [Arthrobacter oryzae]RNL57613.1 phage holin family protein [Arthrobacter oryzae]